MSADVDVVVVGGGPIGLAASIEARLAGLTVAVIEPRDGAIDKACGEGLMPGALPLLARLGVDPHGMPLRGISYRNERMSADYRFRGGEGRGVRRTVLHAALAARAVELGVERIEGKVAAIEQDASGVTVRGEAPRGEAPRSVRAKWLFGCDGLHSTVRRLSGLERPAPSRGRRFGVRQHYFVEPWSDLVEVHWSDRAEAYVTPVDDNIVGIAMLGAPRTDFAETLASIPELAERVRGAEPASTLRGAGPFRQRALSQVAGRVLLLGDASGYVDAITGEGLRLGLDQARAAVTAVANDRVEDYPRAWRRTTRDFRVLTSGLVAAANGPFRGGIVPAARRLPRLYGSIVERLAR